MRPLARWALLVLIATMGMLTPWPPAQAVVPGDDVANNSEVANNSAVANSTDVSNSIDVVIDRLNPLIPRADSILRLGGRLVNTSAERLEAVQVRLNLSSVVLRSGEQIDAVLSAPVGGDWDPSQDYVLEWSRIDVSDAIGPGEQESFSFEVPMSRLPFASPGIYVLSVEARVANAGVTVPAGLARTFVPWFTEADPPAIQLAWVWPLADHPARTASGALLDDRTPVALSPGGRLHQLALIGAERASLLTWVIDPSLVQTAAQIAQGYLVERDGRLVPGDRGPQASAWLDLVRQALAGSTARAMAYADIDAGAVRRADLPNDVVRAVTQAADIASAALGEAIPGGFYWPPGGQLDKATANLLVSAGTTTVVLATDDQTSTGAGSTSVPANGIASFGTPSGSLVAIVAQPRLAATLAMPQRTAAEVLLARQRFLAETGLLAQAATGPLTVVAAPIDIRWSPARRFISPLLRATQEAPWLQPVSLDALLGAPRGPLPRLQPDPSSGLPEDYLYRVRRSQDRLGRLASVLQDPGTVIGPYSAALLRAESSAWRDDLATGEQLVRSVNAGLAGQADLVHVLSSGTITFSGDVGKVPVTVANDADQPVTIGLSLFAAPSTRLESDPIQDIVIDAGRKVSLDVTARVIGSDPLPVKVQLLTPEGKRYGTPGDITLISTAYARVASWVVMAAFAALAVFVVVGIIQRIRRARRSGIGPA